MENVMTKGFCELNEQEMMETDGGLQWFFDWVCGANAAKKETDNVYERSRQGVIDTLKRTGTPVSTLPPSTIDMWNLGNIVDPDIVL